MIGLKIPSDAPQGLVAGTGAGGGGGGVTASTVTIRSEEQAGAMFGYGSEAYQAYLSGTRQWPHGTCQVPCKLESAANQRLHWRAKAAKAKEHRQTGFWLATKAFERMTGHPRAEIKKLVVTLTRIGVRRLDDDNLAISFKNQRDGVADYFGVDDGSDWYEWKYKQRKGKPKEYAVEVRLEVVK